VKRLGLQDDRDADLSAYQDVLTDMHALLTTLVERGAIDQAVEQVARSYFDVQDKGWQPAAPLGPRKPLFVDGLALIYLHTVNLLDPVLNLFPEVYVDSTVGEEVQALIDYENHTNTVLELIDDIRSAVHNAHLSGKLVFGPMRTASANDDEAGPPSSTLNLIADLMKADLVVIDDRALNKELFAIDGKGHRARLATSLDILEDLVARGELSEANRQTLRHRLRAAGAVLMPMQTEEVVGAALRSKTSESAEFRAIAESLGLAYVSGVPHFPTEIYWFMSVSMSIQRALIQIWNREPDTENAACLAEYLLNLRPDPTDWATRWEAGPPPGWGDAVFRVMPASLALPVELQRQETLAAYNNWLEARVLSPLRAMSPERYRAVVDSIRTLIIDSQGAPDE
jgi:hypothetical protein